MSSCLDAALAYACEGLAVFPLAPNTKIPLTDHGFKDAVTDEKQIREWWGKNPDANVAIATGAMSGGLVVVDLDVKDNKNGISEFKKWIDENHLFIPDTPKAKTWSGGEHYLFKSSIPTPCKTDWLPGVDVRGDGGYIVAPPSEINGFFYEWVVSLYDKEIVDEDQDEDVYTLIQDIRTDNKPQRKENAVDASTVFALPDSIQKGGRNDTITRYVGSLQRAGYGDFEILDKAREANARLCKPPMSAKELEGIVRSVLRYEKGSPKTEQQKSGQSEKTDIKFDFELMDDTDSANSYSKKDIKDLIAYIGTDAEVPLLVEGTCVLAAKTKLGKSWFCTNLCWSLATGRDFLGYKTRKCKVRYYDLEQGENVEKKRIVKVSEALNEEPPDDFLIRLKLQRIGHGLKEQLEKDLSDDPDIGVFVIDIYEKIKSTKSKDKSDYEHVYEDFSILNEFAHSNHISVVLLFHSRKMIDPTDPFADILGTTGIQGACDQMIVLTKDKFSARNTKLFAKGRTLDGIIEMEYVLENGICSAADAQKPKEEDSVEEYMNSEIRDAVIQLMKISKSWKGRCTGFINECARNGIGLDADVKTIGIFFGKHAGKFMKHDGIYVEIINNGSGGRIYSLSSKNDNSTVDTVDEWMPTVDGTPFDTA